MKRYAALLLLYPLFLPAQSLLTAPDTLPGIFVIDPSALQPYRPPVDPWFSGDKFLHFYFSAATTGLSYHVYAGQLGRDHDKGRILSVSLTSLIGIGKELYDLKKKRHFSWKDLAWDGLGIAVGYLAFAVW